MTNDKIESKLPPPPILNLIYTEPKINVRNNFHFEWSILSNRHHELKRK